MLNQFKPTNLIVIMGPTAGGKTLLAAHLAARLNSGVISADSRQVYKGMDIGTGKDLADYTVNGTVVPYYLIDIVEAGTKYNVYEYQKDFVKVFNQLLTIDKIPVLCGGSGLYIEAVLKGYRLISVPVNEPLRAELAEKDDDELIKLLQSCKKLHNRTDTSTKKRIIRAIEIEIYYSDHAQQEVDYPEIHPLLIAVSFDRKRQREKITERLHDRLNNGMIDEVKKLLNKGISSEDLIYYGLEYKFITQYLTGGLTYDHMFQLLNSSIHQFAKRQMTWLRKMERDGAAIHWIDGELSLPEKLDKIKNVIDSFNDTGK